MDSRASALVPSNGSTKRTLRVGILQSAARLSEYADAPRFPKQFSTFPLKSVNLPKIGQLGLLFAISGPVALLSNYWGVAVVSFLQSNSRLFHGHLRSKTRVPHVSVPKVCSFGLFRVVTFR